LVLVLGWGLVLVLWRLLILRWLRGVRGWRRVILLGLLVTLGWRVALRSLSEEVELGAGQKKYGEAEGEKSAAEAGRVGAGLPGVAWEGEKRPGGHSFLLAPQVLDIPVFSYDCRRLELLSAVTLLSTLTS